ncbi:hypothetical protein PGIGA_G00000250 [Pangasianodon gigas]|uniref:Uncharacterized protein n=1 Tax=Pangasianodon gigas TaxID=30993 RepID=A0ACC5W6F6_PANGG|nr:hypothetical protein [Pangasianodon gigas]
MKAFGLGFPRPLLLAATSCSAPCRYGNIQGLGVGGHRGQTFVLSDGQRDREREKIKVTTVEWCKGVCMECGVG